MNSRTIRKLFSWYAYEGGFWIRICNHGLEFIDKSKYPPLFSERNGYKKVLRIGKWGIEFLRPDSWI